MGKVKGVAGFFSVYNRNEYFYSSEAWKVVMGISDRRIKMTSPSDNKDGLTDTAFSKDLHFDVLLTNPPYSADHVDRLFQVVVRGWRPPAAACVYRIEHLSSTPPPSPPPLLPPAQPICNESIQRERFTLLRAHHVCGASCMADNAGTESGIVNAASRSCSLCPTHFWRQRATQGPF